MNGLEYNNASNKLKTTIFYLLYKQYLPVCNISFKRRFLINNYYTSSAGGAIQLLMSFIITLVLRIHTTAVILSIKPVFFGNFY